MVCQYDIRRLDMLDEHKTDLVEAFMDAWNRQEVEKVADCYAEDLAYILFEGNKIKRNEVYFDRTALAALLMK
jgi:hypothetical protein